MKQDIIEQVKDFGLFVLNRERWQLNGMKATEIEAYRTSAGHFVTGRHDGKTPGLIKFLIENEIAPELASPTHGTCSIGQSAKSGKWYGWSHRAMVGFGPGDRIFEEKFGNDETLFVKHGRKTIKTDADAKLAAKAFARYVS